MAISILLFYALIEEVDDTIFYPMWLRQVIYFLNVFFIPEPYFYCLNSLAP